jgi:CheY-like chemotaxis protein
MKTLMTPQPHHSIPAALPPANCFTVLVIDDLLPNRVLLRKILRNAGYAVVEAGDGAEALRLLRDGLAFPDLVVTDIEMPEMDGISFVGELRRLEGAIARVPVIAASGNADDAMRQEALEAGADLFLTKPFDLAALRREIGARIQAHRLAAPRATAPFLPSSPDSAPNRVALRLHEAG